MAPPPAPPPLLLEKVLLVTVSVPPLEMAPPTTPAPPPLAMVRFWTVNVTAEFTENTPTVPPPLMVIKLPPSMVVLALMVFVLVTVIVAAPPQANVTVPLKLPPPGRQASNAASVQLALVPVPTTHAKADEVAASTPKTSSARTSTNRVRAVARPPAPWDRRVLARALATAAASVRAGAVRIANLLCDGRPPRPWW